MPTTAPSLFIRKYSKKCAIIVKFIWDSFINCTFGITWKLRQNENKKKPITLSCSVKDVKCRLYLHFYNCRLYNFIQSIITRQMPKSTANSKCKNSWFGLRISSHLSMFGQEIPVMQKKTLKNIIIMIMLLKSTEAY